MSSAQQSGDQRPADRRQWARKELIRCLPVRDEAGVEVGRVGDVALGGMMLLHRGAVAIGQQLTLSVDLPPTMTHQSPLTLRGVCRWSEEEVIRQHRRCGIEFLNATPEQREILKDLIVRFVGELAWDFCYEAHKLVVALRGSLDEEASLDELLDKIERPVCFDLAGVRRVNSYGVGIWSRFIKRLASVGRIELRRCSPAFVSQLNVLRNFKGPAEVLSVNAPFMCDACSSEQAVELAAQGLTRAEVILPRVLCKDCGGAMGFDDLEERYFAFLDQQED